MCVWDKEKEKGSGETGWNGTSNSKIYTGLHTVEIARLLLVNCDVVQVSGLFGSISECMSLYLTFGSQFISDAIDLESIN